MLYEIDNSRRDIPALRKLLTEVLERTKLVHGYQFTHEFQSLGQYTIRCNVRRILSDSNSCELILLALEKIIGDQYPVEVSEKKHRKKYRRW